MDRDIFAQCHKCVNPHSTWRDVEPVKVVAMKEVECVRGCPALMREQCAFTMMIRHAKSRILRAPKHIDRRGNVYLRQVLI